MAVASVNADRWCRACNRETSQFLGRFVLTNGEFHCCWWCRRCENYADSDHGGGWVLKRDVIAMGVVPECLPTVPPEPKQLTLVDLPVVVVKCRRCRAFGVEVHHWAPRAVFGDEADKWPTDALCTACHREWHARMNARTVA